MSVINLPQNGPIFIPGKNPGDPLQVIIPFEGAGIDMPSSDSSSFEKATGLVINVADWQVDSINAVLKDNPKLLSKPTSTVLKVLGKVAGIVDIGLIGFKTTQGYQEGENWRKVLAEESGATIVGWALSGAMVIGVGLVFGAAAPVTVLAGLGALLVGGAYTLSGLDGGVKGMIGSFFNDPDPSGGRSDLSIDFGFEIPDDYLTQEVMDTLLDPAVVTADVLNSLTTPEGGFLASVSQFEKKTYDPADNFVELEVFSSRPDPEGQATPGLDNQDGSRNGGQVASKAHFQLVVNNNGSLTITFFNENLQETQLELTAAFVAKSRNNLLNTLDDFIAAIQFDAVLKVSNAEIDRMITQDLQNSGMSREDLKQSIFVGVQDILRTMGPGQTPVLLPEFQDVVLPTIFTPLEELSNGDMVGYRGELILGTGTGGVPAKYHVIKTIYTDRIEVAGSEPGTTDRIPQTKIDIERLPDGRLSQTIEKKSVANGQFYKAQEIISTDSGDATVKDTTIFNEAGGVTSESTDVFIKGTSISVGQIGSIFGSTIGRQLTDSQLGSIALGTVLGAIGQNLFQTIGLSALGGKDLGTAIDTALGDFGIDLTSAGRRAVSSFLVGQLLGVVGLNGIEGEVLQTTVGSTLTNITNNIIAGNAWDAGVSTANFANIMGGFVGSKLASQIISFDTVGGQIGASVGGAAGAYVVGELFGKVLGNFLAPGIGAFVGFIVGGLVGSLFGGTPRSAADVLYNPDTGEFGVSNVWSAKGGSSEAARNLASIAAANLNGILAAIGGTVVNEGRLSGGTYGTRKSDYTYRVDGGSYGPGDPGKQTIARTFDGDNPDAASLLIEYGVLNALDDLVIAGGDVFLKRVLYGSLDTLMTGSNVQSSIQGEAINVILGNFQTAADYRTYIQNAATINALIAAEPESAFAAANDNYYRPIVSTSKVRRAA